MTATPLSNLSASDLAFDGDLPVIPSGFGLDQSWFGQGRTSLTVLRHGGIGEIVHFGRQAMPMHTLFRAASPQSAWGKVFRLCLLVDGTPWYPEFNRTRLSPHGYLSTCTLAGVRIEHELTVLDDAVVQRVRVLANPRKRTLALRLVWHGGCRATSPHRTWSGWEALGAGGAVAASALDRFTPAECRAQIDQKRHQVRPNFLVADVARAETQVGVAITTAATHRSFHGGFKHWLDGAPFTDEAAAILAFAPDRAALRRRLGVLRRGSAEACDGARQAVARRLAAAPRIAMPDAPAVASCMANVPLVVDALAVADAPGAYRAAMHAYWVWLDLFFNSGSFAYSNDPAALLAMLRLHRGLADRRLGIPALVTTRMQPYLGAAWHTQCLFITALYHHHCATGDHAALRELLPFACWLMDRSLGAEVGGSGLIEGAGLPDFPVAQDGHDLCSSGNSIHYQALRALARLARSLHEADGGVRWERLAGRYDEVAQRCLDSFRRLFWDARKGYYIDSVSSRDLSPRRHYPVFAVQWVTHWAADLIAGREAAVAGFLARNFTARHGLGGMIPRWDTGFPGDGNQIQAYYPSWSEAFYRQAMMLGGRRTELERWFGDVEWFWRQHAMPEGLTLDAENEGFTLDNPGCKQAFAGQAWYGVLFRSILGLEIDHDGLVLTPTGVRRAVAVRGLEVRGRRIDIALSGRGGRTVTVDGVRRAPGRVRIPFAELAATTTRISL